VPHGRRRVKRAGSGAANRHPGPTGRAVSAWLAASPHAVDMSGMTGPRNLYPQSEGPFWDEVPGRIPDHGDPGVRTVSGRQDQVDIAAYDGDRSLVAVLSFGVDRSFAQPVSPVWVITRPDALRRGWATRLYAHAERLGFDMEAASDDSLADSLMTPDGYDFMLGRRARRGTYPAPGGLSARAVTESAPRGR
jgi:hypothetical protein